jgi:hypothetical protein
MRRMRTALASARHRASSTATQLRRAVLKFQEAQPLQAHGDELGWNHEQVQNMSHTITA